MPSEKPVAVDAHKGTFEVILGLHHELGRWSCGVWVFYCLVLLILRGKWLSDFGSRLQEAQLEPRNALVLTSLLCRSLCTCVLFPNPNSYESSRLLKFGIFHMLLVVSSTGSFQCRNMKWGERILCSLSCPPDKSQCLHVLWSGWV